MLADPCDKRVSPFGVGLEQLPRDRDPFIAVDVLRKPGYEISIAFGRGPLFGSLDGDGIWAGTRFIRHSAVMHDLVSCAHHPFEE